MKIIKTIYSVEWMEIEELCSKCGNHTSIRRQCSFQQQCCMQNLAGEAEGRKEHHAIGGNM